MHGLGPQLWQLCCFSVTVVHSHAIVTLLNCVSALSETHTLPGARNHLSVTLFVHCLEELFTCTAGEAASVPPALM